MNGNARPPDQNGQIQIGVNPNQKKDEGSLQILDMDISMIRIVLSLLLVLQTSAPAADALR